MATEANGTEKATSSRLMQWQRRTRLWLTIGGLVLFGVLVWQAADVLLLFFLSVLLALFLRGVSDWVSHHTRLSSGWSLAVVMLTLLGMLSLTGWLLAPQVSQQFAQLSVDLPRAVQSVQQQLSRWRQQLLGTSRDGGHMLPRITSAVPVATGMLSSTLGILAWIVIVLVVGFYLAADPQRYVGGVLRLFPADKRWRAREVCAAVGTTLQRWLLGRLLLMAMNGAVTALGLWLLGLPLALALGLLSAVLNFMPNLGPLLAGMPAVLLAFLEGPTTALYVLLFYVAYQTLDGYVLTPLVQKQTVALPPALTIMGQVLLGVLFGVLGVLLAVPLTAMGMVLLKMLYVEDVLGEPVKLPGQNGEKDEHTWPRCGRSAG